MARYQSNRTKAEKRAHWMARYEALVVAATPETRQRQDFWDGAIYFHLSGHTPEAAAAITIAKKESNP